jgi:hypothetical protein
MFVYTQTITHPWWVVDRGGGKATSGDIVLRSSIGQPAIQKMTYLDTGNIMESGFMPGLRTYSGSFTTLEYAVAESWNMISLPLIVSDSRKTTLFPTAVSDAFAYVTSYETKDTLHNGVGYWLKFPSADMIILAGTSYMRDTIDVSGRWNMIGALDYPILVADVEPIPPMTITSVFFGYDGIYNEEDTLKPGKGYWVKTSEAGKLVLKTGTLLLSDIAQSIPKQAKSLSLSTLSSNLATEKGLHFLTMQDGTGRKATLYFTAKKVELNLNKFDLPPTPPVGFDVRFNSQRSAVVFDIEKQSAVQRFPIMINGAKDPVTITWVMDADDNNYSLETTTENEKQKTYPLKGSGSITINTSAILTTKLMMGKGTDIELPKEFALQHNYPNPFNPTTTLKYALPVDSKVKLTIYNLLGEVVEVLVDGIETAGFRTTEWNSSTAASGVYFFRLDAVGVADQSKSFTQVKKMLLVR